MANLSVRLSDTLKDELDKTVGGGDGTRNKFIVDAIKEKLAGGIAYTDREKREIVRTGKSIGELVDEQIKEALEGRLDLIASMSPGDLAKLAVSRLPKTNDTTNEEEEIVDLLACIDSLPGMDDLTEELKKSKGDIERLKFEFGTLEARYELLKKKARSETPLCDEDVERYIMAVRRYLTTWVCDLIARGQYPGYGDEGGESDSHYAANAAEVRKAVENAWRK